MTRSLVLIVCSLLFIFLSFNRESATKVKPRSTTEFSAENVMDYLDVIAAETHPIGSTANNKVRDYLVKTLSELGLETKVESGHVDVSWGKSYSRTAFVENVIALLPGTDSTAKKVVLAAHYDSVFEGPGAADDGYAVAAMIESVKLLSAQPRKNDVLLLITDGEEMGLLGARYYIEKHDMDEVGVLLNYEARGNQGPCIAFEWSDDNAWLVREMKKSAIRPIANSLSYEIYKLMPNSSDFTAFAKRKVSGINHAFIDGFSYYHNPADNVENLSKESVQHTGENMYLMAKHFANYDFSKKETGNASFFNFYRALIIYPPLLDTVLLFLVVLLILAIFIMGRKSFQITDVIQAFFWMFITIVIVMAANYGLGLAAKNFYPQYATFYIYHYYNHEWYFVAGLGLSVLLCALMSRKIISEENNISHGAALFLLLYFLTVLIYFTMPTGSYIMLLPALGLGLMILARLVLGKPSSEGWLLPVIFIFFLVGMWSFLSHGLFLAFSLSALPGAVFPATLGLFASMYLLPSAWQQGGRKVIIGFGALMLLASLVIAHIKTTPSEAEPLLTNLQYVYDTESEKKYIASFDDYIHDGHLGLLENAIAKRLPKHLPYTTYYKETDVSLSSLRSTIKSDSVVTENSFSYSVRNPKRASIAYIHLPDAANVDSVFVDKRYNKNISGTNNHSNKLTIYGYGLDSLNLRITKIDPSLPAKLYVNMEYRGLAKAHTPNMDIAWNDPVSYVSNVVRVE